MIWFQSRAGSLRKQLRLLDEMSICGNDYANAVQLLANSIDTVTEREYLDIRLDVAARRKALDLAKERYHAHKNEHGC